MVARRLSPRREQARTVRRQTSEEAVVQERGAEVRHHDGDYVRGAGVQRAVQRESFVRRVAQGGSAPRRHRGREGHGVGEGVLACCCWIRAPSRVGLPDTYEMGSGGR